MSSLTGSQKTEFIDGSTGVHTFTTAAHSFGSPTSQPALRIVAFFSILSKNNTVAAVTSVTDFEGFTWHKAGSVDQVGINQPSLTGSPLAQNLEIWYSDAFPTSTLTGGTTHTLTVNTDNDIDSIGIHYSLHKDIDPSRPLDLNASFPASDTQMSGSTAVLTVGSLATDTANIQVCVGFAATGPGQRPGVVSSPNMDGDTSSDYGQGDTFHLNVNYNIFGGETYDKTAALAAATIATTNATNNGLMLCVVFTQDDQSTNSYANFGGTGDRRGWINIWSELGTISTDDSQGLGTPWNGLLDGSRSSGIAFFNNASMPVAGKAVFQFDFIGPPRIIDEVSIFLNSSTIHEVMQWQGSNDGVTWDDLGGTVSFDGGSGSVTPLKHYLGANDTAYESYRMFGVSGNVQSTSNIFEFEFKIDNDYASGSQYVHATAAVTNFNNLNTKTIAITTTVDSWLVLIIESNQRTSIGHPSVTSVTDDNGNTWTKRDGFEGTITGNTGSASYQFVEYWYARQTTADTTTITVNTSSNVDSANLHVIAFHNLPDMSTLWKSDATLTHYDFAGSATQPSLDYPDFTGKGLAIFSAVTPNSTSVINTDLGYDKRGLQLLRPRNNGNFNWAYGNHSLMLLNDPSGRAIEVRGTSTSIVITSDVINLGSGAPSPDGNASGATITVTVSLLPGSAARDGEADGDTIVVTADIFTPVPGQVLSVAASLAVTGEPATQAIDGSKIYEFTASEVSSLVYQTVDEHSIYSRGDRISNGLIIATGEYGWDHVFSPMSTAFDDSGINAGLGNGPDQTGSAYDAGMYWQFEQPVDLRGIRSIGHEPHDEDVAVMWSLYGAVTADIGTAPYSIADGFPITAVEDYPGTVHTLWSDITLFSPRSYILYDRYDLRLRVGPRLDDRLCNEFWFSFAHSNLDGGDRRPSAPASKRVAISFSSGIIGTSAGGSFETPQQAWFDGIYNIETNSKLASIGALGNVNNPITSVGEWVQFIFPRPVKHKHVMLVNSNLVVESYTGDDPDKFGVWHWEYSLNTGVSWTPVGDPWSFREDCAWMVAPRSGTFDLPDVGTDGEGATHWRMVLDQGPAFGLTGGGTFSELLFDLDDITGQAPPLEIAFTDDNSSDSNPLPVPTIGTPGSPYVVAFTDGTDDKLSLTLTNIPNPILTIGFTDGTSDRLDTFSDLYPSIITQIFVKTNGRN